MTSRFIPIAAALAFLAAAAPAAAAGTGPNRLLPLLPADSDMVFLIEDMPGFLESWPATPLGRTWNDPEVKTFLAPMRETMELDRWEEIVREGTGFELSEILDTFTGPVAVAILDLKATVESEENGTAPPVLVLAEIAGDGAILRELLAADLDSSREEAEEGHQIEAAEEEFRGETLHFQRDITADGETETDFWAIVDNVAVLSGSKDVLQGTVAAIREPGGAASIDSNESFQRFRTRFSPYDLLAWVNLGKILPVMIEAIEEAEKKGREEKNGNREGDAPVPAPVPFDLDAAAMVEALGLDALHGAALAHRFGEQTTRLDIGLTFDEGPGIVRILDAYRPGPVELPAFLPDDVIAASIANYSLPLTWKAIREILQRINPQMDGLLEMQLGQLKTNTGIDIEGSLLSSIGDRMISASFRKPAAGPGSGEAIGQPDVLYGIALADRQGLEMVLELAKNLAAPFGFAFDEQEFLGQTIYVAKRPAAPPEAEETAPDSAPPPSPGFAYALTPDYLFISLGTAEPIRTVLSRIRQPGRSIWARPEVQTALAAVPGTASGLSYLDFATLIMQIFEGFVTAEQFHERDEEEATPEICNPDALPDRKVLEKYLGLAVGAVFREKGGLYMTTRVHAAGR